MSAKPCPIPIIKYDAPPRKISRDPAKFAFPREQIWTPVTNPVRNPIRITEA